MTNTLFPTTLLLTAALCSLNACERHDSAGKSGPSPMLASLTESAPAATPAAEAPASNEQSDRLWAMRKKVQQRGKQRTGTYLEQLQGCLSDGDLEGAEAALKSAIAQGTLSQSQIDEAKGRIASGYSSQQAKLVAEARAKEEAGRAEAARAAEVAQAESQQQRMARNDVPSRSGSDSARTSNPDAGKSAKTTTEEERFRAKWRNQTANFTVTSSSASWPSNSLIVQDSNTGLKFKVGYDIGIDKDIFDSNATGASVSIRFNGAGTPASIKSLGTGRSSSTNNSWKVTGYGW